MSEKLRLELERWIEKASNPLHWALMWEKKDRAYAIVNLLEAQQDIGVVLGLLHAAHILNLRTEAIDKLAEDARILGSEAMQLQWRLGL